jgi:hypothetical protein
MQGREWTQINRNLICHSLRFRIVRNEIGGGMVCKVCASENIQELAGELSASFVEIKGLRTSPIYVCQNVLVCLECGFTELVIPRPQLEQIKKGNAASGS